MNALVFLGIAAVLSAGGCLVLWLRNRQPRSIDAHIREFARELDALAPGPPPPLRPGRVDRGEREYPRSPRETRRRPG